MIFNAVRPNASRTSRRSSGTCRRRWTKSTDPSGPRAGAGLAESSRPPEPGPNGSVLYVFVLDPAVPGADYGLGRILRDAFPDRIQEIWKLYTDRGAGGGSC